jgi:2-oxoacid dehydrogenases acyltransferase (catalytic domain)
MTLLIFAIVSASFLALWILVNYKTSRPDGTLVGGLHLYRRVMQYIMPTRNESVVFFDTYVRAEPLLAYIEKTRARFHVDVSHCLVAAVAAGLAAVPEMNRFAVGRRLYQRTQRHVTFSMKRTQGDRRAKLATVKLALPDGEPFQALCARIDRSIDGERAGVRTYADKEFDLLGILPRPLLLRGVQLARWLDHHNLLPAAFLDNDPLYTSVFVANVGSLDMGSGYHHLYEWGNCPVFMMVGRIEERPAVETGQVVVQKQLHVRWTYDERIDDGLTARHGLEAVKHALENPDAAFGVIDHASGESAGARTIS